MLPIKRLDHISMAAPDFRAQAAKLERLLGFKYLHDWEAGPNQDFEGCVAQVRGTEIEFEVIAPARPDSFVQKFLEQNGPGLHHITMEVEDIHAAAAELERLGLTPFGGVQDDGSWYVTYIHPKESGGILWQLFVAHRPAPEVDRTAGGGIVGLERMDHVSMAVPDLERQVAWQQRVFGMELLTQWEDEQLGYRGAELSIPGSLLKFEIIAPTRPESFVQRFIEQRRPGMHHITCEVASVDRAVEALRAEGIEPWGGIIENDWKRHTFIHPRDSGGVLFQLFEE
ncbi:VOC family protein [Tepidiforma sp.]|uniref:VOC family protein n=1 Tax=Tepidiforma sp. TaxID=2682230 RepID=UPI002ADD9B70|nr:VOC family protein [Tepidiforma sp.]